MKFLRFLTVDPVNLSLKGKTISLMACFCSIFFIALITRIFALGPEYPMIVASMGASAIILFFIPNSPLAQPWPFAGGQICSAVIGVTCALNIPEIATAASAAVGGSILVMLFLRCLHPPGAATSLAPVMAGESITSLGYDFIIQPVTMNVVIMLLLVIFINRWVLKLNYPSPLPSTDSHPEHKQSTMPSHQIGISEQDLAQAIKDLDFFVDMTHDELSQILTQTELNTFKRIRKNIFCSDIMISKVISVEYGTDVEDAWKTMLEHKLKALPVTDKANFIIGILTWHDFFKFINLSTYESFPEKLRSFIRRTTNLNAEKPESVGHIMTSSVTVVQETAHIVELIPLMSTKGFRQIPIINSEHRLVGMVYQSHLISALYNASLANDN
jgi:CBS domain-containing membrane protein